MASPGLMSARDGGAEIVRSTTTSEQERIQTPAPRPVEEDEEENEAVDGGELTAVHDRKKAALRVRHEIRHRHHAAGDERRRPGEESGRDEEPTEELDPRAQHPERVELDRPRRGR